MSRERMSDLITEIVNWDSSYSAIIKGSDDYSPDDFSITKSRYKDGSLRITIRLSQEIEQRLKRPITTPRDKDE